MNRGMTFRITGQILQIGALTMLLPALVAIIYGETPVPFFAAVAAGLLLSRLLMLDKPKKKEFYATEGFLIVALSWLLMSIVGAVPFVISGAIPGWIDAFFETVSGFTTTGSTILTEIESLPRGILFWRSFTHWIGGMGVLVLVMAVVPLSDNRAMHLMRAEVPGPTVGKLVPKARETAKILYGIYMALTIIQVLLLLLGGMPLYDSLVNSFSTAGTGGYSVLNASMAGYESPYAEWVTTIFMLMFGVNFNLYYILLFRRQARPLWESEELRWYLGVVFASTVAISWNIMPMYDSARHAIRDAAFQVSSIITTTGYVTADYDKWPYFSQMLLVLLMFVGACAGSTGGGIKVSRTVLLAKSVRRDLRTQLSPRLVSPVKIDGRPVGEDILRSVLNYLACYCAVLISSALLLSLDEFTFGESLTAVIATLNNVGPGLGAVGATGNFSGFQWWSKLILSFDMLVGRLEIYPMLMLFYWAAWRKK